VTYPDFLALLPLIIIGYAAVLLLVIGAFWRSHRGMTILTLISLAAAFLSIFAALPLAPRQVTPLLNIDAMALFYIALFCLGALAIAIFSYDYLRRNSVSSERFFVLLLFAVLGMGVLVSSSHFVSFFVGLEALSVSLYGLIGYTLRRPASLEAGLKYLVLAGASLAFLLFGMALIYFEFGTMEFAKLAVKLQSSGASTTPIVLIGLGMMLVGFAFKLAIVPFHTWAPDVYQGSPAPITALIATGSKAAVLVLLLRFLAVVSLNQGTTLFLLIQLLAIITMFGGNLLALLQKNLKRLLAYSSIAHMGYLFIPLLAGGEYGAASIAFYFISYFITVIGAFGVVSALSSPEKELENLADYRGLGYTRPWLGGILALMMLSLAGIPPTLGFIAKFYIFAAAARSNLWLLLIIGLLNSGLAAYYYLRVLVAIYSRPAGESAATTDIGAGERSASRITLGILSGLLLIFGIYPAPLLAPIQKIVQNWLTGQ